MKLTILVLLFITCGLVSVSSCKKVKSGIEGLPALTQTGENTFGCLVNGALFLPKYGSGLSGREILESSYHDNSGTDNRFHLTATRNTSHGSSSINILTFIALENGLVIPLGDGSNNIEGFGEYYTEGGRYSTSKQIRGELKINHVDEVKRVISGTFSFDAENEEFEKVQVREGRFDIKY